MSGDTQSPSSAGTLWVCGTPIGSLDDVTHSLRSVLGRVSVIACEDTRRTRALLSSLEIPTPRLLSHRLDNERASADGVLAVLVGGQDVALVSDAGTPAISDPGARLVRAALDAGITVRSVVGPSAVTTALSLSGCVATGHRFVGFLPRSGGEVSQLVRDHAHEVIVGFESPQRAASTLDCIAQAQPGRRVVVARELSKLHEQVLAGDAESIARQVELQPLRGEVVIVLDAMKSEPAAVTPRSLALVSAIAAEGVRMKTACRIVAQHEEVSARALYERMVEASDH